MSNAENRAAAVIVLAAGAGTRMKSRTPKILHRIGGKSMVGHALDAAWGIDPERLAVLVRHQRDLVAGHIAEIAPDALIVDQDEVPGTGRAVEQGLAALDATGAVEGTVIVTYGDVPCSPPSCSVNSSPPTRNRTTPSRC